MTALRISTDPAELDLLMIHRFLAVQSTWAIGIPLETLERAMANSLCFGAYLDGKQVGFARVISDYATFANLVDVFVLAEHRGHGYAKALLHEVIEHPQLQGLRRFTLSTAHGRALYAKFGFASPAKPKMMMERYFPDIYTIETKADKL